MLFEALLVKYTMRTPCLRAVEINSRAPSIGVSSRYIKEIENHGNVPSLEKLGQLIRALHISADPFFYPAAPTDNLDYQRLLVYLSECTDDQITTILALVEAYLRTYKTHETE